VLGPRDADHQGMKRIAGFIVAVIVINVLLRVVPLPDVSLPSISLPDLPGWVHTVVRVKNFALIAVVLLVIVGAAVDQRRKAPR
jgi:hypothetical protein